ncbi:LysE family transporter [Tamlana sp. 2_MG-2023]|uniref:LysE family translocator n=1 Tax=unclassified Tamlana TaxID=2614803 RepID=UPI0026E43C85|nr:MULTISPECIES: LysE family transporter [unclassified Tamlana]MDO6759674.1 LysE family transporter [Tamlana sp. 2_MG-2023]MDO6791297.1 LysE family transporter [Tamlana sp. 1_MG-2023]
MFDDILTAIPFGIILAFTIGPVFFVLLETSATKGFRAAIIFDLGVILADIIFILIAFYSTNNLRGKIGNDPSFLIFGGVLLIVYGIISFIKTSKSFRTIVKEYYKVEIHKDYGKLFIKGFLLNFINIGVLLGWLGFIVLGDSLTTSEHGGAIFIASMLGAYFVSDLIKIVIAKRLKAKLTPRLIFKTKKVVAIVILAFGILLLVQGIFPKAYERNKEKLEQQISVVSSYSATSPLNLTSHQ